MAAYHGLDASHHVFDHLGQVGEQGMVEKAGEGGQAGRAVG